MPTAPRPGGVAMAMMGSRGVSTRFQYFGQHAAHWVPLCQHFLLTRWIEKTASGNGGAAGPNQLAIGAYGAETTTGEFGILLVYNRVLTETEIQTNFNALRGRFNI